MLKFDGKFLCARRIHLWEKTEDAQRCCNGWIRLMVPIQYGLETIAGVPVTDPYKVATQLGGLWKAWLIREEETEELERLLALMPLSFRSSTEVNPGLFVMQ